MKVDLQQIVLTFLSTIVNVLKVKITKNISIKF